VCGFQGLDHLLLEEAYSFMNGKAQRHASQLLLKKVVETRQKDQLELAIAGGKCSRLQAHELLVGQAALVTGKRRKEARAKLSKAMGALRIDDLAAAIHEAKDAGLDN